MSGTTRLALMAAAGTTAATLAATGLVTAPGTDAGAAGSPGGSVLRTTGAAAATLTSFADCEELRRAYVEAALPRVGPWGFDQPFWGTPVRDAAAANAEGGAVQNNATGTNVQEAGVDEPDIAKTDGSLVVRVHDRHLVVLDARGAKPRRLSRLLLPGPWQDQQELLLVGDTALVVGHESGGGDWGPVVDSVGRVVPGATTLPRTHLTRVDLADPADPVVVSHQRVDGDLVAAREYGDGTTRVVVSTGLPELDFVRPTRSRSRAEARRENRAVVTAAPIESWLPGVRQGDGRGHHPLLGCADVLHPSRPSGFGTLSVLTFGAADPRAFTATAVLAEGDLAYSSAGRLYVATLGQDWWDVVVPGAGSEPDGQVGAAPSTDVHAFALDGASTTYTASGRVRGTVRDRWSFSEHDGLLRVATALGRGWEPRENAVQVLAEQAGRLRVVGRVDGLGPREQIQSVRWLGDLAVVVTFRQVDPLYTLDLADPTRPRVLGALKVPGFSAYLHPLGDGLLLGLGEDADRRGVSRGGQAAVFDLTDLHDVRRRDTLGLGRWDRIVTAWEPRAFTYLPGSRTALVPVESWNRGGDRLLALRVGRDGGLTRTGTWHLGRWGGSAVRALPLADGRVAVVQQGVRIVEPAS